MAEQKITILRVGPADIDAFRRIRLEALRSEPGFFASTFDDWDTLPDKAWHRRLNNPVFIAFLGEEPVALIGLLREKGSKSAHRATVVMVYVRKSLRGRGIASDLFSTVENYARDIGVTQLELTVSAENSVAIGFYLREGFIEIGRIPGGFIYKSKEIDEVLMARRLPV